MANGSKVRNDYDFHEDITRSCLRQQCISGDDGFLESKCPLDYGRHVLPPLCGFDLGALEKLPVELRHEVLQSLNLRSLLAFRQVNRHVIATVDSLTE
jgi:hypothetical protein